MTRDTVRAFVVICGKTLNSHKPFLDHLTLSPNFRKVTSVNDSDVIIAFAPVVSRAGTDIEAALQKIQAMSATQRVVLVVLHHTTERDPVIPNSSRSVNRSDVFTVDCLFNEDRGLLSCQHNDQALKAVKEYLGLEDGRPPKKQWAWQLLFWTSALLSIILIYCLTTPKYIHAVWFIPWMLLLLVILLERQVRYHPRGQEYSGTHMNSNADGKEDQALQMMVDEETVPAWKSSWRTVTEAVGMRGERPGVSHASAGGINMLPEELRQHVQLTTLTSIQSMVAKAESQCSSMSST
ncbi:uncharacterized protein LOC118817329 [Colossoma macropomum]|uniref:uncharacterized protein LOC118817329 n=1 Tax=Colossoma macropomum TaxID=42526 RepID=UPI001864FDA5|nr:uncharacterized protein LOC118817329 [Colossoma macropomum]